ncbi:MAG: TonB-dependent receptor [Pseudomonas sp.]
MAKCFKSDRLAYSVSVAINGVRRSGAMASAVALLAGLQAAPALAQSTEESATTLDTISVIGAGSTRTTAAVSKTEIENQVAGVAPQALLASLPGVNVQTSDPFGLYEFGDSMHIRGFSSNQLGVTLDGIPLETSDVREGGPISRYVLSEDLADVSVSAGSGDVTQPSYHALGGAIRYTSADPIGGDQWHGSASQTIGSNNLVRTFFRLETPDWWEGGPAAYFAVARTRATQWDNSEASMKTDHFETKIKQFWGDNSLTLAWRYNKRDDHDMQNYTIDGGYDWQLYKTASGDPTHDASYYGNWTNGRIDSLLSLQGDFFLTSALELKFTVYGENKRGYGMGTATPSGATEDYEAALEGTPGRTDVYLLSSTALAKREEIIHGDRKGATASLTWTTDHNALEVGGWFEHYKFDQVRPLWNLDPDTGALLKSANPILVYYDRHFTTKVAQVYVKDTIKLLDDRLTLEFGGKGLKVKRDFEGIANLDDFYTSTSRSLSRTDSDWFQPQAGASFSVTDSTQLFANYAENFSATPRGALVAYYSESNSLSSLKPEKSRNIDLGIRSENSLWSGYVALYHISYENRIVELTSDDPYAVNSTVYQNVGNVESYGAEISGMIKLAPHWTAGTSMTYNRSKFMDDYTNTDGVLREVTGNEVPDSPKIMFNLNTAYNGERVGASLEAKYTGSRYGDTMNTELVPSNVVANGSVSYKGEQGGFLAGGKLQLSVYNIFNESKVGAISANETYGSYYWLAPRSYYLTLAYDF